MFPSEELASFLLADEFFVQECLDEAVAEEFGEGFDIFYRQEMEAIVPVDESGGGENMNVGMKTKVISEGLHGGDCGNLSIGKIESGAHPVAEAFDGNLK